MREMTETEWDEWIEETVAVAVAAFRAVLSSKPSETP